jgi:hypothetical protein
MPPPMRGVTRYFGEECLSFMNGSGPCDISWMDGKSKVTKRKRGYDVEVLVNRARYKIEVKSLYNGTLSYSPSLSQRKIADQFAVCNAGNTPASISIYGMPYTVPARKYLFIKNAHYAPF